MLKQGMVSDEINEYFSKLDIEFMRKSPIAIVRKFEGSGKRGSLSPTKKIYVRWILQDIYVIGERKMKMNIIY